MLHQTLCPVDTFIQMFSVTRAPLDNTTVILYRVGNFILVTLLVKYKHSYRVIVIGRKRPYNEVHCIVIYICFKVTESRFCLKHVTERNTNREANTTSSLHTSEEFCSKTAPYIYRTSIT
jgi:hypothetical protein